MLGSTNGIATAAVLLLGAACLSCGGDQPNTSTIARDSLGIRLLHANAGAERLSLTPVPFSSDVPDFSDVRDVALAPDGHVVVLDPLGSVVVVLDSSGAERTRFGGDGEGPGEFRAQGLTNLVIASDTILVPDAFSQRVSLFDLDGQLVRAFPLGATGGFTLDWQLQPDGSFAFRRLSSPQRIEGIDRTGASQGVLSDLSPLALPPEAGPLTALPVWCMLPDGRLAVARSDRYRVTVGAGDAPSAILTGDLDDRPFGQTELEHLYELVRQSLAQRLQTDVDLASARDMVDRMALPESAPVLGGVVCSERGEVWVQHALPVHQMRPSVTRVGSPEGWRSSAWDVFQIDSARVEHVELPAGAHITRVVRGWAVGYTVDELGQKEPALWRRQ